MTFDPAIWLREKMKKHRGLSQYQTLRLIRSLLKEGEYADELLPDERVLVLARIDKEIFRKRTKYGFGGVTAERPNLPEDYTIHDWMVACDYAEDQGLLLHPPEGRNGVILVRCPGVVLDILHERVPHTRVPVHAGNWMRGGASLRLPGGGNRVHLLVFGHQYGGEGTALPGTNLLRRLGAEETGKIV